MNTQKEIPSLTDAVEPSDFVFEYKDLDVQSYIGRLAPSFGLVVRYKLYKPISAISREFVQPDFFLLMTDFNPSIIEALKSVNKALQAPQGTITLPLTQEMGFGKTHFETLLLHLYTGIPKTWKKIRAKIELGDAIEKLTEKTVYKLSVAEKTIVLPIDLKSLPESRDPYSALFENCARIIENYKPDVEEPKELAKTVRELGAREPKRAATELASQIKKTGVTTPILILIDELYASVYETVVGGDARQINSLRDLIMFVNSFIDELKEHSPIVLVYASAQQDINRFGELMKVKERLIKEKPDAAILLSAVDHFETRTSRVQIAMKQITSEDVINIIRKRLLKLKAPIQDLNKPVAKICMEIVAEYITKDSAFRYYEELLKTYPFTPTYRFFAEKLLAPTIGGDLPRTQHIRDLLKATASIIARVHESGDWNRISLISPAHLTHDDVNHLVEERLSMEWRRLYQSCINSIFEVKDADLKYSTERMLSVVYIKSFTTNISKLLDMIRAPEILAREEMLVRGTSLEDLISSIVGAIPTEYLPKFHDAYDYLSKSTPYVIDVEYAGKKYLVLSFVFNPMELIESYKREEVARLRTTEGLPDYQKMTDYLRNQLETEYNITGMFTQVSEKPGKPKLTLVNYNTITTLTEKNKPKFLTYLDRDRFSTLILTPWSIAEKIIEGKKIAECTSKIVEILLKFRNEIPYPNMLAIVFPQIEKQLLESLCIRIAEMHAAKKIVTILKVERVEEARRRRLELAKRTPTYHTLLELLKEEEKKFEDIIMEIMESLQKRIEEYAKTYTNTAVQNYISEFVGAFRGIIYYDLKRDAFREDSLEVKYETKEDLNKVFAELPLWTANAVVGKCIVDNRNAMISKIIKHVAEPYVSKHKQSLTRGEKHEIAADPLVAATMRGWKTLPIRPLSRKEMENAIESIGGNYILEGLNIKVYPQIEKETRKIMIEPVLPKPQLPPPPTQINIIEISGASNVVIGLSLLQEDKLGSSLRSIDISLETEGECILNIEKASLEDLKWIVGEDPINTFINRLSSIISELRTATLRIKLLTLREEQKLRKIVTNEGISEENFNLFAG